MELSWRNKKIKEIEKWRKKIDKIDVKIVRLLNRRARYADEIGKLKRELGLPIYSPEREQQVVKNVIAHNFGPLSDLAIKRLYERIIDESRRLERESVEKRKLAYMNFWKMDVKKSTFSFIALIFLAFLYLLVNEIFFARRPATKIETIKIARNQTFKQVVDSLYSKGIVKNKFYLLIIGKILKFEKEVKAGKFIFPDNLPLGVVIKELLNPSQFLAVTVTIPEGLTARKIAGLLKARLGIDSAKFMALVNDPSFTNSLGIKATSLEGYLMPETYAFIWGDSEEDVITKFVNQFKTFYADSFKEREKVIGLTTHEVITLASIVEGEAKYDDEKPIVAGVYFNRLKRNLPLEADPTIQYIIPDGPRRLFYKDLRIQSPYNTYLNRGLPPGPVSNPGKQSILAVLYPMKHNYLYFVADGTGRHVFSKTYSEHLRAVRKYRKALALKK